MAGYLYPVFNSYEFSTINSSLLINEALLILNQNFVCVKVSMLSLIKPKEVCK